MLGERLVEVYRRLDAHFGHEPHWWPIITDDAPFEMMVGMVLVQQTRWQTVEAAVYRLRDAGLMTPARLAAADTAALAALLRPCAFHTQKAPGLQAICHHLLEHYAGDAAAMLRGERQAVRAELLGLPRVGRETADTIMLYGGGHPIFIVDAYARRLFGRLGLPLGVNIERAPYDVVQVLVEEALGSHASAVIEALGCSAGVEPHELHAPIVAFYWRFHALIVEACIHHCLASRPRQDRPGVRPTFVDPRKCFDHCRGCVGCPLRDVCATYRGVI
jgi:endonuclease-3 related protein